MKSESIAFTAMCETFASNFAHGKNNNKTHLTRPQITHTYIRKGGEKSATILYSVQMASLGRVNFPCLPPPHSARCFGSHPLWRLVVRGFGNATKDEKRK